jgi:hypothetical protein
VPLPGEFKPIAARGETQFAWVVGLGLATIVGAPCKEPGMPGSLLPGVLSDFPAPNSKEHYNVYAIASPSFDLPTSHR